MGPTSKDRQGGAVDKAASAVRQPIIATLNGSNSASALGVTANGVIALCRKLVGAGHDPHLPLHAYRGATLALIVTRIGAAASLEVHPTGTHFVQRIERRIAPPITSNAPPRTTAAPQRRSTACGRVRMGVRR